MSRDPVTFRERSGDYQISINPGFKDELRNQFSLDVLAFSLSRDGLRHLLIESFEQMGIPGDVVLNDLRDALDDPDYISLDRATERIPADYIRRSSRAAPKSPRASGREDPGVILRMNRSPYVRKILRQVFLRWKTRVLAQEKVQVPVRLFTLHCPKVEGALCIYEDKTASAQGSSFALNLFGTGIAGSANVTCETGSRHTAKDGRCYKITKTVEVLARRCREFKGNKPAGNEYILVSPVSLKPGYRKLRLSETEDACQQPDMHDAIGETVDLSSVRDPDGKTLKVAAELSASFEVGFDLPVLKTTSKLKVDALTTTEKSLDYTLPGKRSYESYELTNDFGYAWSVRK